MKRQPEPALRVRMLLLSLRPPTVTAPDRGGGSNLAAALFIQRYLSVPQRGFAPYSCQIVNLGNRTRAKFPRMVRTVESRLTSPARDSSKRSSSGWSFVPSG